MFSDRQRKSVLLREVADRLRRSVGPVVQLMERRLLFSTNVSGTITTPTTWTAAGGPYILTAATYVASGTSLTIQSGVTVETSNSSQLYISNDNSAASLNASGATFDVQLNTTTSAQGTISNCTFNTAPLFNSTSPGSLPLSGNTFNSGVDVNPYYVSSLAGNTFKANSTVYVLGGTQITNNLTWGVIPNVSQYEIVAFAGGYDSNRGVHVESDATLTLSPGVDVTTDGSNSNGYYDGIYIAEDSSGAKLIADGSGEAIAITAPLYLDGGASATIANCSLGGSLYAGSPGAGGISITNTAFSQTPTFAAASTSGLTLTGDTFSQSVNIHPELIPLVNSDTFSPNATIYVEGGTLITTNVAWSVIPNVTQYEIYAYSGGYDSNRGVHVESGATLTLSPGVEVVTDGSNSNGYYDGIYVSEDSSGAKLISNGVSGAITITAPIFLDGTASAVIADCALGNSLYAGSPGVGGIAITNTTFSQTPTFAESSTSGLTLTGDTFSQSVNIDPQIIPLVNADTFSANATIYVEGGTLVTTNVIWSVIPNVSQYEIYAYSGGYDSNRGVHVESGATLTLSPGVEVVTDSSNSNGYYDGIYISEDSSGAKLISNGSAGAITITAPLFLDGTASAVIANCSLGNSLYAGSPGVGGIAITNTTFSQTPTFAASSTSGLTLAGDTFSQSVNIHPQLIPLVNADIFGPDATIYVEGGTLITSNVTWSVIPNVAQYEIYAYSGGYDSNRGVHVESGATLTLSPGVEVVTDGSNSNGYYDGIYIAEDSSGARLIANGSASAITITAPLYLDGTASVVIAYCQLGNSLYAGSPGVGGIAIINTTFSQTPTFAASSISGLTLTGDNFSQSVNIHPQLVPLVSTDIFSPDATIYVEGGTLITTNVTWSVIPNVVQYEIYAYSGGYDSNRGVHVESGATLTISPGVEVITDGSNSNGYYDGIYVSEDSSGAKLNATAATLVAPIYLENNAGGSIQYTLFDKGLTISGSSSASVANDSLGTVGVVATGSSTQTINLENNWWGTINTTTIAGLITDHSDNSSLPTVLYSPVLTSDPTAAQAVTLSGYASYFLKMDADGVHTDIWYNATGTGSYGQQLLLSLVSGLTLTASGGAGSVTFDNSAGYVLPSGGTALIGDGGTSLAVIGSVTGDSVTLNSGQLMDNNAEISFSGITQTLLNPNGGADLLAVNAGKLILTAPAAGSGINVRRFDGISIGAGAELQEATAANHGDRVLMLTEALAIAGTANEWTGTLDLGGNDLDIQNGSLVTTLNQLATGFNSGAWNSTGVESSTAASNGTHLTALGALQNNQSGFALFNSTNTFDGIIPAASDVLVKYTYYGDTNLDGKVDGSDYAQIDNGSLNRFTSWFNGDFNYDGVVNGTDYTLIDNAYNQQGATLAAQILPDQKSTRPASRLSLPLIASQSDDWLAGFKNKATDPAAEIFDSPAGSDASSGFISSVRDRNDDLLSKV